MSIMNMGFTPFHDYGLNSEDEEIKNGNREVLEYFNFFHEGAEFPTDHWELKIVPDFGKMGSGKTEFVKSMSKYIIDVFNASGYECEVYQTNDLINLVDYLRKPENIGNAKKVLIIIFDDVMNLSGLNSVNTFSQSNKDMEQLLSVLRHYLNNEINNGGKPDPIVKNGVCYLFYCCQDTRRLSTFIRRNNTLIVYKTFFQEGAKDLTSDAISLLKQITTLSDKSVYAVRAFSIAVNSNGECMRMYFPMIHDPNFIIPILNPKNERLERKYSELITELKTIYNDKMKGKKFTAWIKAWGERPENQIDISRVDQDNIELKIMNWYFYEKKEEFDNIETENKLTTSQKMKLIDKMRTKKITWKIIGNIFGIARETAFSEHSKWKNEQKEEKMMEKDHRNLANALLGIKNHDGVNAFDLILETKKRGKLRIESPEQVKMQEEQMNS